MHDVIGHVVVAVGDEDLRALDAIAAIGRALGLGAQRADVGAGLRLGELHGAGPFAGHQLLQIDLLQFVAAMGVERLDRGERQQRAEAEGDVRRAPDFGAGRVDRERQALAAERFRARHRVPARRRPAPIGVRPAGRGGDLAVVELDAVLVADPIERRQHVGGELAGFLEHRRGNVGVEIAVVPGLDGGLEPRAVVERKQHVVDRRAVGHGNASLRQSRRGGLRLPTKPASLNSSDTWTKAACRAMRRSAGNLYSGRKRAVSGQFTPSLLKWLNSLYRPTLPRKERADDGPAAFRTVCWGVAKW